MNRTAMNFLKENGFHMFPQMLQFEITLKCPFNCSQCYKKTLDNQDMDYDYLTSMINLADKNDVNLITLNGGEPLLYPKIDDLLTYIGEKKLYTNIFSSGFNLTQEVVQIFKKYDNIHFFISLNGSTKEINSLSREGYDGAIAAIKELSNNNILFGVNWVARHDNISDFPNLLELCRTYGVSAVSVTSNKLTGIGSIQSPLDSNDIRLLSDFINNRDILTPAIMIESCFSMLSTQVNGNKNRFSAHCYAGISNCTVNCDGTFQPCTHLKYPERFESIDEYWFNSRILKDLRDNPPDKLTPCRTCKNNVVCSLCRVMSIDTYQDFHSGARICVSYLE